MDRTALIEGISNYWISSDEFRVSILLGGGRTETLLCSFQPLLAWIESSSRATVLASLRDHPMKMEVSDGVIVDLVSVSSPTRRSLRKTSSRRNFLEEAYHGRRQENQDKKAKKTSSYSSNRRRSSTRTKTPTGIQEMSAGVRICPSCHDAVDTTVSLEHGKRIFRCRKCGGIAGYT